MGADMTDLEADFRPSPTDPNWLSNNVTSSRATTYGFENRAQGTFADAYGAAKGYKLVTPKFVNTGVNTGVRTPVTMFGAIDETVPYGYDGKTVPVYSNAYGALPAIDPMSLLLGAVAGVVGVFLYKKFF